jgi:hypothetical protein
MDFIELFYSWAVALDLYSPNLDTFLVSTDSGMNYVILFMISLGITLLCLVVYYIWPDRPGWAKKRYWFLTMAISAVITFIFSSQTVLQNQMDGLTGEVNQATGHTEQLVSEMDCWMFGLSDTILFIIIFFVLSFLIRLGSTNNRYMPFYIKK